MRWVDALFRPPWGGAFSALCFLGVAGVYVFRGRGLCLGAVWGVSAWIMLWTAWPDVKGVE